MSNYPEFSSQSKGYASPPITVILTVTLLLFFFIGFFAIYFCRCFMEDLLNSLHLRRTASGNLVSPTAAAIINTGLEPSIIQAFPTFPYSSVKGFCREKYGLECAICLCEFEDDSILRLLTGCYHVFHQECIDLWLESHKTCPVCRRDLDNLSQKALDKSPMLIHSNSMHDSYNNFEQDNNRSNESLEDAICISIKEDEITETCCVKEEFSEEKHDERGHNSNNNNNNNSCSNTRENEKYEKKGKYIARSNSTGHSVQDDDKHTLRLPEHVKVKIVRGHDWKSCVTFGDFSSHTETCRNNCNGGYHGGEVSSREIN